MNEVAREVQDPEKNMSVLRRAQLRRIGRAQKPDEREDLRDRGDLRIGALGDGSDYAPFLDHAGVAALNMGFGGEADGGIYHSIYDDFYWYTHFGDPDFLYEKALAQMGGTAVMRMADADVLPYDPSGSADTIKRYVGELKTELKKKQDEVRERNREIEEGVYMASADPTKQYVPPTVEPVPPYLNFAPLENGAEAYSRAAQRYKKAVAQAGGEQSHSVGIARVEGDQRKADADGADLHHRGRSERASLVQAPDLRARGLYRVRREDHSCGARNDGRRQVAGRRRRSGHRRGSADEAGQAGRLHRAGIGAGGGTSASGDTDGAEA